MLKCKILKDRVTASLYFKKTDISFREALYQTCKNLRSKSRRNFILPVSGGSDSQLVSYVLRDLKIEAKRIHQRYYYRGNLINAIESKNINDADEYQDIDVEEFQKSRWFQERFVEYYPTPVCMALQPYIRFACDPEKDIIVSAGTPLSTIKFSHESPVVFSYNPQLLYRVVGLEGFQSAAVLNDNPIIMYSFFDDLYRRQVKNQSAFKWESQFKKEYYETHFPEISHMQKSEVHTWEYLRTLNVDRRKAIYMQSGVVQECYPQRTWLNYPLKDFYEKIDKSKPIHLEANWAR